MANLFTVTTPANAVTLDANRTGQVIFTVANTSPRSLGILAQVVPSDPGIQSWFQIEQGPSRQLNTNETAQYTVTVRVPASAAAGDYNFHLTVAEQSNPDDNFVNSSAIRVTVPPPSAPPAPKPFPWWIIAVAALVIIVIVAIIVAVVVSNNNQANANATATVRANAATQTAAFLSQQGATQTAQFLNQAATQTQQFLNEHAATATIQSLQTQTAEFFATQTAISVFATKTELALPPANISVSNQGAFVVQFTVSYTVNGAAQNQGTGQFPVGTTQTISIPGFARNISVQVQVIGVLGNGCGSAFTFATARNVTIVASGTVFSASCSQQ